MHAPSGFFTLCVAVAATAFGIEAFTVLPVSQRGLAVSPLALRNPFRRGGGVDTVEAPVDTDGGAEVAQDITGAVGTTPAAKQVDGVVVAGASKEAEEEEEAEELSETQKLMEQVKDAGLAGVVSYALWELGFWAVSVPVCVVGYREVTGHWPDLSNQEDVQKLGAEAFAFVNFARFAVPLRIGLALSTTPWIQENIIDRFGVGGDSENGQDEQK